MSKKSFPRAVMRTAEQMREASAQRTAAADNVIEMPTRSEPSTAPTDAALPSPASAAVARGRRRKAAAIVERYANYSAVGGAIPVPLANAAALTALLVRMVRSLSDLYEVPFERNRTRAIVIGLMGGALPTGFATIATSVITAVVPGYNLLGLAVSSVTSSAYARSIGQLYIEHFENGATVNLRSIVLRGTGSAD